MNRNFNFGVDYYPEHWPRQRWELDCAMMKELGIQVVRLAEFSWKKMEPKKGEFHFEWLDEILGILEQNGIKAILGTPSAAPPKWIIDENPEILPTDFYGIRRHFGGRHHDCQSNEAYREHIRRFVTAMATHFAHHPAVVGWQVDNELGNSHGDLCMCPSCTRRFQRWLEEKYQTIERLNQAWGTYFWSQGYDTFQEIEAPQITVTGQNPSQMLDWKRFCSDLIVEFQQMQIDILRRICKNHFITHNFMGFAWKVNYFQLAKNLDFASHDQYTLLSVREKVDEPGIYEPPFYTAAALDLMRGTKQAPFWVMEQQSSITGWTHLGPTPRPGQIRLWTADSIAHGADTVVYFRWRSCLGGTEQYWHGILPHSGVPGRAYEEISRTIRDFGPVLGKIKGAMPRNQAAVLFSYDQEYALQIQPHHPELDYVSYLLTVYRGFYGHHIGVDFIQETEDFASYRVVAAPLQYLMTPKLEEKMRDFVLQGGTLILTMRTGVKNWDNLCMDERPLPGNLGDIAGIEVPEYDCLREIDANLRWPDGETGTASKWCDLVSLKGADPVVCYDSEYYAGTPAVTKNRYGKGLVYYVGTELDPDTWQKLMGLILHESNLPDEFSSLPEGVEIARRTAEKMEYGFVMNHSNELKPFSMPAGWRCILGNSEQLEPFGVSVFERENDRAE